MKKILFSLLIASFAAPLSASYEEALKLYEEKKYEAAIKAVAAVLVSADDMKEGSPNYKQRYLAAHIHWKLGNADSCVKHFRRCMDINKTAVEPNIDLALFLIEQKRYGDAEEIINQGLKKKEDPMLFYALGKANLGRKNYARAKELFEKTNALDPELYVSYNDLGITLMKMNKYGDANTAFSVAHAIRPDSVEILNNLALSFEKMEKFDEALRYISRASELDANNASVKKNLERIKGKKK